MTDKWKITAWQRSVVVHSLLEKGTLLHRTAEEVRFISPEAAEVLDRDYERVIDIARRIELLEVES